ncbi:retrovirus-related Pol polyprotein from transposon 297 [Trichonephila clavipes]|nr:retrovirus-related Pol polyprotein from transposon 297 [Trichonephila clavipes]
MPFGLAGASGTFQREMNRILKSHSEYAQAYMDDVVIFSKTFEEHLVHLELVLAELEKLGFSVRCIVMHQIMGVGCCLTTSKDTEENLLRPIAFASQKIQWHAQKLGKHRERGLGSVIRVESNSVQMVCLVPGWRSFLITAGRWTMYCNLVAS